MRTSGRRNMKSKKHNWNELKRLHILLTTSDGCKALSFVFCSTHVSNSYCRPSFSGNVQRFFTLTFIVPLLLSTFNNFYILNLYLNTFLLYTSGVSGHFGSGSAITPLNPLPEPVPDPEQGILSSPIPAERGTGIPTGIRGIFFHF